MVTPCKSGLVSSCPVGPPDPSSPLTTPSPVVFTLLPSAFLSLPSPLRCACCCCCCVVDIWIAPPSPAPCRCWVPIPGHAKTLLVLVCHRLGGVRLVYTCTSHVLYLPPPAAGSPGSVLRGVSVRSHLPLPTAQPVPAPPCHWRRRLPVELCVFDGFPFYTSSPSGRTRDGGGLFIPRARGEACLDGGGRHPSKRSASCRPLLPFDLPSAGRHETQTRRVKGRTSR